MKKIFIQSLKIFLVMTLLTGIIYPLFISAAGQLFFSHQANGSLIVKDGIIIGSSLIGQKFADSGYFHPRPSAINYNPIPSGASNLGLSSALLQEQIRERKNEFRETNLISDSIAIPSEMIFASGSGVDPHISKQAAQLQISRIVKARNLNELQSKKIIVLVDSLTESRQFGIFGCEVINVLELNIKLDELIK